MAGILPISEAPEMEQQQASAEVLYNEGLVRAAALGAMKIIDRDLSAPPGSEADGAIYIPKATATGAWATHEDDIAVYYGGYFFISPVAGMQAYVADEKIWIGYDGTEWHPLQDIWSTTEHFTGKYDGASKVYSKVIDTGIGPVATSKNTAHSITSLDLASRILVQPWIEATGAYSAWGWRATANELIFIKVDATNVVTKSGVNVSAYSIVVRLEYCKT